LNQPSPGIVSLKGFGGGFLSRNLFYTSSFLPSFHREKPFFWLHIIHSTKVASSGALRSGEGSGSVFRNLSLKRKIKVERDIPNILDPAFFDSPPSIALRAFSVATSE
jgi:hypothetical protein